MGFRDDAVAAKTSAGPRCGIATIADKLDPGDADELEECLADPSITDSMVRAALAKRGFDAKINMLGRHRRRQCSCPPFEVAA